MGINNEYNMVKEFHKAFNHPYAEAPTLMPIERAIKRIAWLNEEIQEFAEATKAEDLYEQVDAMIDVIYFALGTLVELGVPPADIFKIVQDANMSKLFPDKKPHFNDVGKVIKPSGWVDPHEKIVEVINQMGYKGKA